MFLAHIVLALCTCSAINHVFVRSHHLKMRQAETEEEENKEDVDVHTFVALIDIVFTDYSKRTCTGTIIHDTVVITAAHCFIVQDKPHVQPELTTSFVVIGTKKMFETKYEQYLPIERVIIHPKYIGWTADLALVYTFSGMSSDKPGTTIPLDGERTSTPVDSNVTVLSWGSCLEQGKTHKGVTKMDTNDDNVDDYASDEIAHRSMRSDDTVKSKKKPIRNLRPLYRGAKFREPTKKFSNKYNLSKILTYTTRSTTPSPTRYQSRYLSSGEAETDWSSECNSSESEIDNGMRRVNLMPKENDYTAKRGVRTYGFKSLYHNWRRNMGSEENKLTVNVFGFVNMQVCKKMVEKVMPAPFAIRDSNDIVCYASEDHFITAEDSGAPAIRRGHLVAMTVGGAKCDGDHVAIGMKMSCYCSWITENLPDDAAKIKCCKNCCDVKHREPPDTRRSFMRIKHLT